MLLRGSLASVQSEPSATWLGPPFSREAWSRAMAHDFTWTEGGYAGPEHASEGTGQPYGQRGRGSLPALSVVSGPLMLGPPWPGPAVSWHPASSGRGWQGPLGGPQWPPARATQERGGLDPCPGPGSPGSHVASSKKSQRHQRAIEARTLVCAVRHVRCVHMCVSATGMEMHPS